MFDTTNLRSNPSSSLDVLDRVAIAYIVLPLLIFLVGWLAVWAALPLVGCVVYSLRSLFVAPPAMARFPVTPLQITVAVFVGCAWTVFGGTEHLFFANSDWHMRDAILHDLVVSPWPVGYGELDGKEILLRAPIGYYMPAALIGKWVGLAGAHWAMSAWTAIGAIAFLLQVLSLTPSRPSTAVCVALVLVFFSGFDIVGGIISVPRFVATWDIARNLEWWAGSYVYPSMTSQLFWAPNHSLAGWLTIGLLCRNSDRTQVDAILPIVVIAVVLWSPLAALGVAPFVVWKAVAGVVRDRSWSVADPRAWAPALLVGIVICAYLTLDIGRIPKSLGVAVDGYANLWSDLLRQAQFFLLEAGLIGFAVLAIMRSSQVVLALGILALLPLVNFGSANDFVMRVSIPSLAVLAIACCLALTRPSQDLRAVRKKWVLGGMLVVGAMTPFQEFARAIVVPAWPINLQATLIGANCGGYPEHYVVRLADQAITHLLRPPHNLPLGIPSKQACDNPAVYLLWKRGLP
ncbi:MAG: hypothetical protein ABJC66_10110 [Gammaproteobacteria bacterium]